MSHFIGENMRAKIIVTWLENSKHFDGKLATARHGFCEITRTVTLCPSTFFEDGQWGFVTANGKKLWVYHYEFDSENATWQIWN